ncbi:MAG: hybrid sensor histidine kinase/response regulator [Opitutaceae bacterium]
MNPATTVPDSLSENRPILIVDDEAQNLQLVGEILRREHLPFIFALNGAEALEVIKDQTPSLILLDVMMPGLDGFQVCQKIKEDPITKEIPIIFLTASSEISDIVSGFSAGGVDYIKKPFVREELLARVNTHLDLHAARLKLARLHDYKSDLITTMAHDIKNPAGGIQGLALLLKSDIAAGESINRAELCSVLELIHESSLGISNLVHEILEDAQNEHGMSIDQCINPISVANVLRHLIEINGVHAREKSIYLEFDCTYEPFIGISRRILCSIFDNIISNAVKYSPPESKVILRLKKSDRIQGGLLFEVEDTAERISEELKATLFKKFTSGDQPTHNQSTSHGVGLSIVKRLVEMHNGHLHIESSAHECGNVFMVHLPMQVENEPSAPSNH